MDERERTRRAATIDVREVIEPSPPAGNPPRLIDIEDGSRELIDRLCEDAEALRCRSELEHIGHVIRYGSSADRQEDVYRQRRLDGASHAGALKAVVDAVIDETEEAPDAIGR